MTEQLETLNQLLSEVKLLGSVDLFREATNIAVELEHPVYDCVYLACTDAIDAPLVTADRRLRERVIDGVRDLEVIELSSFPVHQ